MRNGSLEGVRGAAALLVVFFHLHMQVPGLAATRNGYLAVDLFFVLSGYVIGGAYGARLRDAREGLAFMLRRFGRLWPAHIAASVVCVAVPALMLAAARADVSGLLPTAREAFAIVTMTQGLHMVARDVGTAVSWSAGDEFYVYALFALSCVALRGRARLAAFAALASVGYAIAVWASLGSGACAHGSCYSATFDYGWSRCLAGFFAGALVAEFRDRRVVAALAGRTPQVLTFAATLALFAFADRVPGAAFAAPFVFAALIASMSRDSGPVARLFQRRAAQFLGRISYSLYLAQSAIRYPLGVAAVAWTGRTAHMLEGASMLLASFALAHLLNRFVETPYRQRFNAWAEKGLGRLRRARPSLV